MLDKKIEFLLCSKFTQYVAIDDLVGTPVRAAYAPQHESSRWQVCAERPLQNRLYTFVYSKCSVHMYCQNKVSILFTVTSCDGNFCYPDRVPLTQFVNLAKKNSGMWARIFCWVFCVTRIFQRCNGKILKHRLGANVPPSDYDADILPLRHCILVFMMWWHSLCSFLGFSSRFCSYWQQNFPAVSGSEPYLLLLAAKFSGCACSYLMGFFGLTFPARESKKSTSRDQKAGIFQPFLLFLAGIFRP